MREPGRNGKILSDHRQDDNVAVGGIGNLARWGSSAVIVCEMQTSFNSLQEAVLY